MLYTLQITCEEEGESAVIHPPVRIETTTRNKALITEAEKAAVAEFFKQQVLGLIVKMSRKFVDDGGIGGG